MAIPLLLILLLDIYLRNMNSMYKEKYEDALAKADSIQVLVLGNSHACYAVNPAAFSFYTYNLANVSQSLYFDKRITQSLLPELPKLKYVFISIDYHSLYFSSQKFRDYWSYYGNGIKYKDKSYFLAQLSPTLFGYTPKVAIAMVWKRIANRLKYGKNSIDFDIEKGVDMKGKLVKGFIPFQGVNKQLMNDLNYQNRAAEFARTIYSSNEKQEIVSDLKGFIELLQQKDITPVLFSSPTYGKYNLFLNDSIINQNKITINKLCETYNIKYWDYSNSQYFDEGDFFNCDHMNAKGAFRFSTMLNDSILNMANTYKLSINRD